MPRASKTATFDQQDEIDAFLRERGADAGEPGTLQEGDIVNRATNEDAPFPMTVHEVSSAGYTILYDNRTGDPSRVNNNMVPDVLKKTRDDGSFVFTRRDPGFRPVRGEVLCRLHENDPDRKVWDGLGLPTCRKSNLKTEYEQERHMARRHPQENGVIKAREERIWRDKFEAERQEDRAFQRAMMEKMANG